MRILALLTDAYGGRGGIAQHNRHLLDALCSAPGVTEVVALPRVIVEDVGALPDGLTYRTQAVGAKSRYAVALVREMLCPGRFDLVVSGHLNLLPFGVAARVRYGARLIQIVHGIEAWDAPGAFKRRLIGLVDRLVSVSHFSARRVQEWSGLSDAAVTVIPNAVDLTAFSPGAVSEALLDRYDLKGRRVLLTVARLAGAERYKGFDEIMDALVTLTPTHPDLVYLIVGDGTDRARLESKAVDLGIGERVRFAGYIPEHEKGAHYRLADLFVMPGRGEGFGIVYLEAAACGTPVLASTLDASGELVDASGIGRAVDASSHEAVVEAITGLLGTRPSIPSQAMAPYSSERFCERWHAIIQHVVESSPRPSGAAK